MITHFAFVRAINTGPRRMTNEDLLVPFRSVGLADVTAFQAAGNFAVGNATDDLLNPERLGTLCSEAYGFDARVFVRTVDERLCCVDGSGGCRSVPG